MNRTLRQSIIAGGRNTTAMQHRRGLSLNGFPYSNNSSDDNLDLFSKSRRSLSVVSSDESDVSVRSGRLATGSARQGKSGLDDLLSSADGGKHDYDWLLTPPGTPLAPSLDGNESQSGLMAPRSGPLVRSITTTKASRLSVSQSESNRAAKPTRSSSVTRPSVSSSHYTTYSNKSASILNTSSASVSSYNRPSTPTNRSSSTTRPSTPSARPSVSRSTTPTKPRPSLSTPSIDKPKPSQNSRPSTPTSRPVVSRNLTVDRSIYRPSTPTRRDSTQSLSPVSGHSAPGGRTLSNGRTVVSVSRPSSPSPRVRAPPQSIVLRDFPLETPPNLLTTLPDRPLSAGRSRSGVALTAKVNVETSANAATFSRRQSSPMVTRGRIAEHAGRNYTLANGQLSDAVDSQRKLSTSKTTKPSSDNTGFGRTISKKSLEMAIRHMDIRTGNSGIRPLTGSNLFPQSIRSINRRTQPVEASHNGSLSVSSNGAIREDGNHGKRFSLSGSDEHRSQSPAKLTNPDIYESSFYDMILLKEDLKNADWLRSFDDKYDQGPIFDNGFELLPEPFYPL